MADTDKSPSSATTGVTPQPTERECDITIRKDDDIPGFGAWLAGSVEDGNPTILLNVHATFQAFEGDDEATKEALLQVLMHEFGHALEEYLDLNFSDERVQSIAESYPEINFEREEAAG